MEIRLARVEDSADLLKIYGQYINTAITFEYELVSVEEFAERVRTTSKDYPYLVCIENGRMIGYAYAHRAQERKAYQWNAELSIYLDSGVTGRGLGKKLYGILMDILKLQGIRNVYGAITAPNDPSERLHRSLGFQTLGIYHRTGFKCGKWHDVMFFEKNIAPYDEPPFPFQPITQIALEKIEAIIHSYLDSGWDSVAAAVQLSMDKQKNAIFMIFHTGVTGPVAELVTELWRIGCNQVSLSIWDESIDGVRLLEELARAGIEVKYCYVPDSAKTIWHRRNLVESPAKVTRERNLVYRRALIEDNEYNRRYKLPGRFRAVRYLTIHNTAEPFSARQERDRVDQRRDEASISFHFAVDESEAVQILPLTIHGWHAGDGKGPGNMESIGIEICRSQCRDSLDWLYRRSEENAEILATALLRHFNLTTSELRMHQDWSGKYCPHRLLEDNRFEEFRSRVAVRLAQEPDLEEMGLLKGIIC